MIYKINGIEVDTEYGLRNQNGESIPIQPKAFKLLCYLLKNANKVVSKHQIKVDVWGTQATGDAAVTGCMRSVRIALSDTDRTIIRTLNARGFLLELARTDHTPTIAIYPLSSRLTEDETSKSLCRMLEDDLHNSLCRTQHFTVHSRQSIASLLEDDNEAGSPDKIIQELGVTYLLLGTITMSEDRFRLNINLIDASHRDIVTDSIPGELSDLVSDQDNISAKVLNRILQEVFKVEYKSTLKKRPSNLNAYDHYLRALPHVWKMKKESNKIALNYLKRAFELDANYSPTIAMRSWCFAQAVMYAWHPQGDRDKCIKTANELANLALEKDPYHPLTLTVYGTAKCLLGDLDEAKDAVENSLNIDPNSPWSWNRMGWIEGYNCNPDKSIKCFHKALKLSPLDPMIFNCYFGIAQAYFIKKEYQESLDLINRSLCVERILAENDSITSTKIGELVPYVDKDITKRLVDGLVGAGLKE